MRSRLTLAGQVETETWQWEQMPIKWRGKEARKTEIAMGQLR